ncbi:MAG: hypothetical protein IKR68_02640 [Lachnospiraceae bacterium]|nr:hypothetical protein [Lachnospiraceae bacterium]
MRKKYGKKTALICALSLLVSSLSPIGVSAAEFSLFDMLFGEDIVSEEESTDSDYSDFSDYRICDTDVTTPLNGDGVDVTTPLNGSLSHNKLYNTKNPKNDNPELSDKDSEAYMNTYMVLAAKANDKKTKDGGYVDTKGSVSDNAFLRLHFGKGKIKKVLVVNGGNKNSEVTVNTNIKLTFSGEYQVSRNSLTAEGGYSLPANPKIPNAKFKKNYTTVTLKAIKGAYKYRITFYDKNDPSKTVTVHVENLAFHKSIKKTGMYCKETDGVSISGNAAKGWQNLIIRPTVRTVNAGAGMLNGIWTVDKKIISMAGEKNAVTAKKTAATCYIDERSGCLVVKAPQKKGNIKITYSLNGKTYSTYVKVGLNPKASLLKTKADYEKYGLLYVTP